MVCLEFLQLRLCKRLATSFGHWILTLQQTHAVWCLQIRKKFRELVTSSASHSFWNLTQYTDTRTVPLLSTSGDDCTSRKGRWPKDIPKAQQGRTLFVNFYGRTCNKNRFFKLVGPWETTETSGLQCALRHKKAARLWRKQMRAELPELWPPQKKRFSKGIVWPDAISWGLSVQNQHLGYTSIYIYIYSTSFAFGSVEMTLCDGTSQKSLCSAAKMWNLSQPGQRMHWNVSNVTLEDWSLFLSLKICLQWIQDMADEVPVPELLDPFSAAETAAQSVLEQVPMSCLSAVGLHCFTANQLLIWALSLKVGFRKDMQHAYDSSIR